MQLDSKYQIKKNLLNLKKPWFLLTFALCFVINSFYFLIGKLEVPGGAIHFFNWAENLLNFGELPFHYVQRDVGYPLLIWLSGYTKTNDVHGIMLFHFLIANSSPFLIFILFKKISYKLSLILPIFYSLLTFSANYSLFIHHDLLHIFLLNLGVTTICYALIKKSNISLFSGLLILFLCSITRPVSGLLIYGTLLCLISYNIYRKNISQLKYLTVLGLLLLSLSVAYEGYRRCIFTGSFKNEIPSYTGAQLFYGPYVNSFEYKINLSDLNVAEILQLKQKLIDVLKNNKKNFLEYVKTSDLRIEEKQKLAGLKLDEIAEYFFYKPYSGFFHYLTGRLFEQKESNKLFLKSVLKIFYKQPFFFFRFGLRNFYHGFFDVNYLHPRWDLLFARGGVYCPFSASGKINEPFPQKFIQSVNSWNESKSSFRLQVLKSLNDLYSKYYRIITFYISMTALSGVFLMFFVRVDNQIKIVYYVNLANALYHNFIISISAEPFDRYYQIYIFSLFICSGISIVISKRIFHKISNLKKPVFK